MFSPGIMKHLKKAPDFLSNILDILRKLFNNVSDVGYIISY